MAKFGVSDQSDSVIDAALVDLVERLTQLLQSGQTVNIEELARDHPQHVPRLRQLLPAMQATAKLGLALAVSSPPKTELINGDGDTAKVLRLHRPKCLRSFTPTQVGCFITSRVLTDKAPAYNLTVN